MVKCEPRKRRGTLLLFLRLQLAFPFNFNLSKLKIISIVRGIPQGLDRLINIYTQKNAGVNAILFAYYFIFFFSENKIILKTTHTLNDYNKTLPC